MFGRSQQTVVAPDGREWNVGIRWLPRRPKWVGWGFGRARRAKSSEWWHVLDIPDGGGDSLPIVLIVVGAIIVLALAWLVVFPVLIFLVDLLLVVLIAAGAVAVRMLFRRPWIVQAVSGDATKEWPVVGWRASSQRAVAIAHRIEQGLPLDGPELSSPGTSPGSGFPPGSR